MLPQRPTSVTVIAILHFVFGGLGLLLGLCGAGIVAAGGGSAFPFQPPAQGQQAKQLEYQKEMQAAMAGSQGSQLGQLGADVAISVLMILAGIGLMKVRPWGR